jgi:hypothetical protein
MRTFAAWILVIAAACGSVDSPADDAGDDSGGADADPGAPAIASSTPADGERGVRPLAELEVVLSGAIDPATVTATLTLETTLGLGSVLVEETAAATVTWDADTRTLRVVPIDAMRAEARYRLQIEPLDATLRFETRRLRVARSVRYDGGVVRSYDAYEPDADDPYLERSTIFDGAGPDAAWFTADDDLGGWTAITRTSAAEYREVGFNGPGADGVWRTADDHVWYLTRHELDAAGRTARRITYETAGADGTPFTADDPVLTYYVIERDPAGRPADTTSFDGPGPDGTWLTADDVTDSGRYQRVYDAAGRVARAIDYDAADAIADTIAYSLDDRGVLAWTAWASAPGPDGAWFTTDDVLDNAAARRRNLDDELVGTTTYGAPGADGAWRTADDVVEFYDAYQPFARDQYRAMTRHTGAGPDGTWFTADDPASLRIAQRFDADGLRTATQYLAAAGPDGAWFTADDVVSSETVFDPSR